MIARLILVLIPLLLCKNGYSQLDSAKHEMDTTHSVKKATILSAVLPGAGQVYNHLAQPKGQKKAFWKVPLIYGALGFTGYTLVSNHIEVINLRNEYRFRENNPGIVNNYQNYDEQGLLVLEQQSASSRDYSILAFVLVYALQVTDAAVEAHFVNFDISKDLSLNIKPWTYQTSYTGVSLSFNFR